VLKNVGSNWVLNLFTIAVALVMGPLVVGILGKEGDGVWQLVVAATALLSLVVLGVPMASVRYFSEHLAREDEAGFNRAVGSCMGLYLGLGCLALAAGAVFYLPFDWGLEEVVKAGKVAPHWLSDARLAYWLVTGYVAFGFFGQLPYGIMVAHHDFVLRNKIMMSGLLLKLLLVWGLLTLETSVAMLALAQVGALLFEFLTARWLVARIYPRVRMRLKDFDLGMVRKIFSFSIYVLLLQLGIKLSFQMDALVIGWFLDARNVSYYNRSNMFIVYLVEFLVAIGAVVMPTATKLRVQERTAELEEVFFKWSKVAMTLTVLACLFLAVLGPEFVAAWLNQPEYKAPGEEILPLLMASCVFFLPVRGVGLPLLMGLGKPGVPTIAFLVAGVLNLSLSVLLAPLMGLRGVALGTALPNVIFAFVVGAYACRVAGVSSMRYLLYVVPRVLLGSLPALAFVLWLKLMVGIEGRLEVIMAGVSTCLVFAACAVFLIWRKDPYVDPMRFLERLRRR